MTNPRDIEIKIANYFVQNSENGLEHEVELNLTAFSKEIGLPISEVKLAALGLKIRGSIEESSEIGSEVVWARAGLFIEFDGPLLGLNNRDDAREIAICFDGEVGRKLDVSSLASRFSGWSPRRLNSALHVLIEENHVRSISALGQVTWVAAEIQCTVETLLFLRNSG